MIVIPREKLRVYENLQQYLYFILFKKPKVTHTFKCFSLVSPVIDGSMNPGDHF